MLNSLIFLNFQNEHSPGNGRDHSGHDRDRPGGLEPTSGPAKAPSHSGRSSDQAHRVHRGRRPARGKDRLPAGEGVRTRDLQDQGREPLGDRRAQRVGPRQEEVGLRRTRP